MTNENGERLEPSVAAPTEPGLTRRAALAGAAGLAGAGLIGAGGAEAQAEAGTAVAAEPSLYERLGGIFAIAAVVDRFSDEIIKNPKLNENPALKAWNENEAATRLPGLKFGRTQWVAALAGGPYEYTGLPLEEAHQGSAPHRRRVRRGRGGDRTRPRALPGSGSRDPGAGRGLHDRHASGRLLFITRVRGPRRGSSGRPRPRSASGGAGAASRSLPASGSLAPRPADGSFPHRRESRNLVLS